jgi:Tfp pilus assembly protein FimT
VVIIGVMASVAMVSMKGYGNGQSTISLARSIQFAMMRARSEAMADNYCRKLNLTSTGATYWIGTTTGMTTPTAWTDAGNNVVADSRATVWSVSGSTDAAANNSGAQMATTATKSLIFRPDGTVNSGTTVYVTETGKGRSNQYKVYVYQATGMARMVNNW